MPIAMAPIPKVVNIRNGLNIEYMRMIVTAERLIYSGMDLNSLDLRFTSFVAIVILAMASSLVLARTRTSSSFCALRSARLIWLRWMAALSVPDAICKASNSLIEKRRSRLKSSN